ncbi:MAG: E2/UBC family protein [Solirubrobacterales bacterium]
MQKPIADAVDDIKRAFPELRVTAEALTDGHVWVILHSVGVGSGWNRSEIDLRVKLQPTFPETEPYPFFTAAGLARTQGGQFGPIQPATQIDGESRTQISLKKNGQTKLLPGEDLGMRFQAVIRWLRSPC